MSKTTDQTTTALVTTSTSDLQITQKAVKELKISPDKALELLQEFGEEILTCVMEIKSDVLSVSIRNFQRLCISMNLSPEEAKNVYNLRARINETYEKFKYHNYFSLEQLARLASYFVDFREAYPEDQEEIIENIVSRFGLHSYPKGVNRYERLMFQRCNTFENAVTILIELAEEEGVKELEVLFKIIDARKSTINSFDG